MRRAAHPRANGLLAPALVALGGFAILVALGAWQLERMAWKQELIARAEAQSQAQASPLPTPRTWSGLDPTSYEYRPVHLSGHFRHDDELHVYTALTNPRGRFGGPGWWVVTPLELDGGGIVLVNRGFVPDHRKDPRSRTEGLVAGPVELAGLMRRPERQGPFVPDDEPENNVWFSRDPARMAAALDLPEPVAPFFVDARQSAPGGLPQGGETVLTFRNDHLGYALTWFGLAATLAAVFGFWVYGRLADGSGHE